MTHFLRLSSLLFLLFITACAAPYKGLQQDRSNKTSALKFKPEFKKVLYRCVVDGRVVFKKFHLSGLLFFKVMDDSTTRVVFQNEMGLTFFDFEWSREDSFKVNQIIPQLDKDALVKTLQKDMNLLLMKNLDRSSETVLRGSNNELYHRFQLEKGHAYYIIKSGQLVRIENAGKSKVITVDLTGKATDKAMPESALFDHHKANFTIQLNKIEANADE
jgi:hypothetical protein